MIQKRLEILKDGEWLTIELYAGQGLKYNKVINKIANIEDRSLSHSNTFEIPWTKQNIDTLGLNVFNSKQLADALNSKYDAKYYIDDKLVQKGFVVINNMSNGTPKLNFIDEALTLTEIWGNTTFKDFIKDDALLNNVNSDYVSRINEMKSYSMSQSSVISVLGNINGENFPIAYFPNTVNTIGEKFQLDSDGDRSLDSFNPYQTRPIFNAMAFLNMVTEAYGYQLIKNSSVDWGKMEVTCISSNSLNKSQLSAEIINNTYSNVGSTLPHIQISNGNGTYDSVASMSFPSSIGVKASDINFQSAYVNYPNSLWYNERKLFTPNLSGGNVGEIIFYADYVSTSTPVFGVVVYEDKNTPGVYYEDLYSSNPVGNMRAFSSNNSSNTVINVSIDKNDFNTPTNASSGDFVVGIFIYRSTQNQPSPTQMFNMFVQEQVYPTNSITYDDAGQFEQTSVDLTHLTPTKSIGDIIKGILQRFGALIEINTNEKEVHIFTYGAYGNRRYSSEYRDWTQYHQEYVSPNFNTNYGNNYAIINKVGLRSPYLGNSFERYLGDRVGKSKFKEFAENYNSQFSDITGLIVVNNSTSGKSYDEFSISGSSMLEYSSDLDSLTQRRFNNSTQGGNIVGVKELINVNYAILPDGQDEWYTLIDESLRCKPTFLLPQEEIKNLDLKLPVYVGQLGGFYIIEEIEQYEDESTPVKVKLIKLPNDWGS